MNASFTSREGMAVSGKFIYYAEPEEIKEYLTELGYQTEEAYYASGEGPFGFNVPGTTLQVGYDTVFPNALTGKVAAVAYGSISVSNSAFATGVDNEIADRSIELYNKLYRRFSRPRTKEHQRKWLDLLEEFDSFRYYAQPEEVRKQLTEWGCKTEDYYDQDEEQPAGFSVVGRTVLVSYDYEVDGQVVEQRRIGVYITPNRVNPDRRCLELYERLHRLFHRGNG
jgi:hypothetical protein